MPSLPVLPMLFMNAMTVWALALPLFVEAGRVPSRPRAGAAPPVGPVTR